MERNRKRKMAITTIIGLVLGFAYCSLGNVSNARGFETAVINNTKIIEEDYGHSKKIPPEKQNPIKNEDWTKKLRNYSTDNPLAEILYNGQPTVLDLGSNSCIPCKMMKPILEELEQEYGNKVNVVVLEIFDYRDLASQYGIRVIPTQIFFDNNGNEYWRHEGFLPKEAIQEKLKEMGVE